MKRTLVVIRRTLRAFAWRVTAGLLAFGRTPTWPNWLTSLHCDVWHVLTADAFGALPFDSQASLPRCRVQTLHSWFLAARRASERRRSDATGGLR